MSNVNITYAQIHRDLWEFTITMGEETFKGYHENSSTPEHMEYMVKRMTQHLMDFKPWVQGSENTVKPRFTHDCDQCVFIGHTISSVNGPVGDRDVWICVNPRSRRSVGVVMRYGDEGSEYGSGGIFYPEFVALARHQGLAPQVKFYQGYAWVNVTLGYKINTLAISDGDACDAMEFKRKHHSSYFDDDISHTVRIENDHGYEDIRVLDTWEPLPKGIDDEDEEDED